MPIKRVRIDIKAPIATVFDTVADIRNFSKAVPDITKVDFLTEQTEGVGTRFNETRKMGSKEHTVTLEVTEFEANHHIRLISKVGGTTWDTIFLVRDIGKSVELTLIMEATPTAFLAKITTPIAMTLMSGALQKDMEAVKRYCEATVKN